MNHIPDDVEKEKINYFLVLWLFFLMPIMEVFSCLLICPYNKTNWFKWILISLLLLMWILGTLWYDLALGFFHYTTIIDTKFNDTLEFHKSVFNTTSLYFLLHIIPTTLTIYEFQKERSISILTIVIVPISTSSNNLIGPNLWFIWFIV